MTKINLPKGYLSASQISMYLRCAKQYEFRYIKGLSIPPGIALLRGTALHSGFEYYYSEVISGNERLTPAEVTELSLISLEKNCQEADIPLTDIVKDQEASFYTRATDGYITAVGEHTIPVAVEQEIWYESPCGVSIVGYIDLLKKNVVGTTPEELKESAASTEANCIADYKITGKKWTKKKLDDTLQFHIYAMATGIPDVEIHNITAATGPIKINSKKLTDKDSPELDVASNIRLVRGMMGHEADHVDNIIEDVALGISNGNFPRCSPDGWQCTSTFCGYWSRCRGLKR